MEVIAKTQSVRISPRKVRLVAEAVKRMSIHDALRSLTLIPNRPANVIAKTIKSAVANAVNNAQLQEQELVIVSIDVSESQALKRFHHSTRGRVHPYKKRGSNIRVVLTQRAKSAQPMPKAVTKKTIEKNEKVQEEKGA